VIVGTSINGSNQLKPFSWNPGTNIVDLSSSNASMFARDINNSGLVVGYGWDHHLGYPSQRSFIAQAGAPNSMTFLPDLIDESYYLGVWAEAVNDRGIIIGTKTFNGGSQFRGIIWKNGVPLNLPLPAGAISSKAWDINIRNEIVGVVYYPTEDPAFDFIRKAIRWKLGPSGTITFDVLNDLLSTSNLNVTLASKISDNGVMLGMCGPVPYINFSEICALYPIQ